MAGEHLPAPNQRTRSQWEGVLRSRGIKPTRAMGQNFLVDPAVVARIVEAAGVSAGNQVVEIGPGLGILTRALLQRGASVLAVELDRELVAFLEHDLAGVDHLSVVERDARYVDIESILGTASYRVVANLPYSTGTVIVRHFLDMEHPPTSMTVMVQREVAERMVAIVPEMSLLSLAVQLMAQATIEFIVPPDAFTPPPKVDSAVVTLAVRPSPLADTPTRARLFEVATAAFQRKRKTMGNGLSQGLGLSKPEAERWLETAGVDPGLRPQAVSLSQWIAIARAAPA